MMAQRWLAFGAGFGLFSAALACSNEDTVGDVVDGGSQDVTLTDSSLATNETGSSLATNETGTSDTAVAADVDRAETSARDADATDAGGSDSGQRDTGNVADVATGDSGSDTGAMGSLVCTNLANGAPLPAQLAHYQQPLPMAQGGAVQPGTYFLTKSELYFEGASPFDASTVVLDATPSIRVTYRFGATVFEWSLTDDEGPANARGTYTLGDASMNSKTSCASRNGFDAGMTGDAAGESLPYSANGNTLVFILPLGDAGAGGVTTYERQP